jgi:tripartite-type tricarboxylate transporter receptor subunit TctC
MLHALRPVLILLGLVLAGAPAGAQPAWPDRPLRIVVPYPPGGITDGFGRLAAEWLAPRLGQPVVVENRSGAGGALGVEHVVAAKPDGTTLLVASTSPMVLQLATGSPGYDPRRDLAPIGIIGRNPALLAVRADLGVTTLAEFVALVKQRPGTLDYSSSGTGGISHLGMLLFAQRTGTSMTHVPYRGGAPAMQDLLAGTVAAHIAMPPDALPHAGGGRIRLLAVFGDARLPAAPELPSTTELGLPGLALDSWNALFAPAGTPPAVVARIAAVMRGACDDPGVAATIGRLGSAPVCGTPEALAETLRTEIPLWQEVVRRAGLSREQ